MEDQPLPPAEEKDPRRRRDDGFVGWFTSIFSSDPAPAKAAAGDADPAADAGSDGGADSGGGDSGGGGDGGGGGGGD